ncbi:tetratricopeptide repeat-containing sensor histidine kinase [Spirosoma endophyticum]|uniref:histidine kinase n=1 Tax=Spirosoma endophyticum TaxID=662367 RepID=A0A1I1FTB2_9BACT|nr:tetratricopeptide repeat protein [Spirosoma endophyticum]SFC02564.1 Two-component sensor histidine kinase, contains HisKA and HATPase domains [Spirosoma endophyticum]
MCYRLLVILLISSTVCTLGQSLDTGSGKKIERIADCERLVKHYRYLKPDSATYFAQKGIGFARDQKDSIGVASMLVQLGMIDDNQGKFDESDKKYAQALAIYKTAGNKKGAATVTIRIGVVELRNGNYDKAVGHFLQSLKLAEASRDTFGMMEANYSISWAHLDQHHYDLALRYLAIADRYNERLPFSNISLNIYNNFGVVYREKKAFDKAKQYLQKGISLSNAPEYQGLNITLINNLASVYAKQGDKKKAITLQEEALIRSREIHNYLRELQTLSGLAKTYGDDNPEKAIFYFKQAVLLARQKKAYKQEMRFLKEITSIYKSQGNYQEALLMKEREHSLADSFFYKDMSQHIEVLKSDYELSKSKARIKELSYLNTKNQLELEKTTILRNVTLAGFILLFVILGLLYNQNRIKQQKAREIGEKNKSLELLVEEKEWLLKEIHHRVKNNLQIISSLLHSQGVYLKDQAAQSAIRESQNRVHAMALIHQKLYQSDRLSTVPMAEYIDEIVRYLINSFDAEETVCAQLNVAPIDLDVIQAVLIGLIINEAVTNSLKYAFPQQTGTISIQLTTGEKHEYLLAIGDNGVGLPADFNPGKSRTMGMSLIRGLSKQLGGELKITSQHGLKIRLLFFEEKITKKHQKVA